LAITLAYSVYFVYNLNESLENTLSSGHDGASGSFCQYDHLMRILSVIVLGSRLAGIVSHDDHAYTLGGGCAANHPPPPAFQIINTDS
jgi:hypothetical protein